MSHIRFSRPWMMLALCLVCLLGVAGCTVLIPMLVAVPDALRQRDEREPGGAINSVRPGQTVSIRLTNGRRVTGLFLGAMQDSAAASDTTAQVFRIRTDWEVMQVSADEISWVRPHRPAFLVPAAIAVGLAIDIAIFRSLQAHPFPSD
jgi:hypothetical protein